MVLDTRFVSTFLHKTKDEAPDILLKALAQSHTKPRFLRTDGAGEYNLEEICKILWDRGIDKQSSNPHEQSGNARAETMVNTIARGTRAQLLTANLAPEFWGYAAMNYVDIYNRTPHDSLNGISPWQLEKGTKPDLSWFKPLGCRATVFSWQRSCGLS